MEWKRYSKTRFNDGMRRIVKINRRENTLIVADKNSLVCSSSRQLRCFWSKNIYTRDDAAQVVKNHLELEIYWLFKLPQYHRTISFFLLAVISGEILILLLANVACIRDLDIRVAKNSF